MATIEQLESGLDDEAGRLRPPRVEAGDEAVEVVGFADLMAAVVERREVLGILTALGLVVGLVLAVVLPPRFTSETRIVGIASTRTSLISGLAGLAGGVAGLVGDLGGLSLGGGSQVSPDFYVDLLQSRELREDLLQSRFPVNGDSSHTERLLDQLHITGRTEALRLDKGVRYLKRRTSVGSALKSGIIDVRVTLPRPDLAAAVARRMIELLNAFNLNRLQFQSRQQRIFSEHRLQEAEAELRKAEQDQMVFAERNRSITNSPALQVESARLQRVVEAKQIVYTTLSRSYEEARIAEAKDVPTLTVIDQAEPPARRSHPRPWLTVLIGVGSGLLLGFLTVTGWESLRRARTTVSRAARARSRRAGAGV
jgi:uncharacterized protein involved in exopolysaccharide biosynthesis